MPRTYATPVAFKTAVEQRLRNTAADLATDLHRQRQLFIFDRFLARVFAVLGDATSGSLPMMAFAGRPSLRSPQLCGVSSIQH